ncbi:MAG: cupredoxin domain-containing protein [bacterium]|nr:cupredoxin domain-containing protein [bacterium]
MQSKNIAIMLGVLVIVGAGSWIYQSNLKVSVGPNEATATPGTPVTSTMPVPGSNVPEMVVIGAPNSPDDIVSDVRTTKEFTMVAYFDAQGKWFSLKEMTVKKGDSVRINVTNIKGMHNFNIDELGIKKDLPLNEKVVVEFTADKTGDFVYYCSMPGHRAGGQWGTLHVTE